MALITLHLVKIGCFGQQTLFSTADKIDKTIKDRFILHAYSIDFYYAAMKDFSFKSAIYRLRYNIHPEVLARQLKKCGITTTTTIGNWYWSEFYHNILQENDIKVIGCSPCPTNARKAQKEMLKKHIDMIMSPYGEELH